MDTRSLKRSRSLRRSGTLKRSLFYNNIRQQLNEQLKCLDMRTETQALLVTEIQDYFRRRAEIELEYSKNLDKLARGLMVRHKAEKQKREQWHLFSSYSCWQHLISTTMKQSRDHAVLSEVYSNNMINRFTQVLDDVQRIYRRCRDVGNEGHDEILKVLHELHTAMKTYHTYFNEFKQAETKLRYAEHQRHKLEQTIPREKLEKSKKFRLIEKEIRKRQSKYNDAKLKGLKARNEYLLCIDTANSSIRKYFVDDLSDLIDCMDFGFHNCIARAFMTYISSEECQKKSRQIDIDSMNKCVSNLDSRVDKQKFLEYNNQPFMIPKKFVLHSQKGDEVSEVQVCDGNREDLDQRYQHLGSRLTGLKAESEEIWKTLETAERSLMDMINTQDYDCSQMFSDEDKNRVEERVPETLLLKKRADRQETEDFYLKKFREYTLGSNMIARLQAKSELMRKALCNDTDSIHSDTKSLSLQLGGFTPTNKPPKKKRIGRTPIVGHPKLFGGSLEEYVEATNQEIPLIIRSCIRIINLFGLHHQGIFRISGSQVEINNFKESFERVEDPLSDMNDASDINSVAGVLKLYLRELREPLFPIFYFEQFMEISKLESKHEFIAKVRDVVTSLPRPVFVVLRYLFAFLNHLSEFSDENMMDPYNLAICFGPTLLPIPEDKDQVQYQNLVNELVKNIIIYQEEIFPNDGGIVYEKYISRNTPDDAEVGESPPDQVSVDDADIDLCPSEDDVIQREREIGMTVFGKCEVLEAVAQFDFTARSERELSFCKGDVITLYSQVSNDWWRGSFEGKHGLIPDKYILLKIRDEDDKNSNNGIDTTKRRKSSSSDSLGRASPPRPGSASRSILSESGISLPYCDTVEENDTLTSASSLSSDLLTKDTSDLPSPVGDEPNAVCVVSSVSDDSDFPEISGTTSSSSIAGNELVITEEGDNKKLSIILDSALANVYNSISTLERQKMKEKRIIQSKDTPDLVMDLPVNAHASPPSSSSPTSVAAKEMKIEEAESCRPPPPTSVLNEDFTTAEFFAQSNQCTLKKGSSRSTSQMDSPTPETSRSPQSTVKRSSSTSVDLNAAATFTLPVRETAIDDSVRGICKTAKTEPVSPPLRSPTLPDDCTMMTPGGSPVKEDIWKKRVVEVAEETVVAQKQVEKTMSAPPASRSKTVEINLGLRKVQLTPDVPLSPGVVVVVPIRSESPPTSISTFKPKPKVPPPVMKKPTVRHNSSPELMKKFAEREYRQTSC